MNENETLAKERPTPLSYGRHCLNGEDISAVADVLRGAWLTQGPAVAAFEKALALYCGARHAVVVSNGTAALHLACLAVGVGPGDIGITSPISFVASANCIAYCGGRPGFADVDPRTITLDPAALDDACRRHNPKVIVPVDFAGQPANLPAIHAIGKRNGAVVIEDAAHSLGASYEYEGAWFSAACCAHSELAILSFHPVKHITTGEGGAILTNSAEWYERLTELRSHGITRSPERLTRLDGPWYYEQHELGFNYRLTDFQCALGISQLCKLPSFVNRRRDLVELYQELLSDLDDRLILLRESPGRRSSYHLLVAQLRDGQNKRRRVFESLMEQSIRPQVHYIPVHLQPWYRKNFGFKEGDFPNAEAYYAGCLSLPLFPAMTDTDVERAVACLRIAME